MYIVDHVFLLRCQTIHYTNSNVDLSERLASIFLNSLIDSVNRCPVQLREVLSAILDEIKVKFGSKAIRIVTRIYFKDFICPIICNAIEYNLVDSHVAGNCSHTILI